MKVRLDDRRFESGTFQLFKPALFLYPYIYPKVLWLDWNFSLQESVGDHEDVFRDAMKKYI